MLGEVTPFMQDVCSDISTFSRLKRVSVLFLPVDRILTLEDSLCPMFTCGAVWRQRAVFY